MAGWQGRTELIHDRELLGLYLHIPFCQAICSYCNFNRGLLDPALKRRYVDAIEREIRNAADGATADTIFSEAGRRRCSILTKCRGSSARCRDACADG
jgi:oxygen-independent coproporphyrinogen-3 oxidase